MVDLPGIGQPMSILLIENGDEVAVTIDNMREYAQAHVDCILNTSIEKQAGNLSCTVCSIPMLL